jgi:hypothetical protein
MNATRGGRLQRKGVSTTHRLILLTDHGSGLADIVGNHGGHGLFVIKAGGAMVRLVELETNRVYPLPASAAEGPSRNHATRRTAAVRRDTFFDRFRRQPTDPRGEAMQTRG